MNALFRRLGLVVVVCTPLVAAFLVVCCKASRKEPPAIAASASFAARDLDERALSRARKGGAPQSPMAAAPAKPAVADGLKREAPPPSPGVVEAPIDPNGRFATTYRPGGGHLSAFDSAVARGIVPPAERELVADIGARYQPDLPEPTRALGLRVDIERSRLSPSGGPVHVRLALRSTDKSPTSRPRLSVHLLLDVSGSMNGESIKRAREAAESLVGKLKPTDDFSLVTFSSEATVRVPEGLVGGREAFIRKAIAAVEADGSTNLGQGLEKAYEQAKQKKIPEDAVRVVFLLSDGRANTGRVDPSVLSGMALDAFQSGIQTSTFGLGSDYDGALMSQIAADGAGGYYYLRDAEQIAPALATELGQRLDPVATAVEVRLRFKPDVEVLKVYGSRRLSHDESERVRTQEVATDKQAEKRDHIQRDRQDDAAGGMRFFIPAFARDDSHAMLLKLRVPAGTAERQLALIELKYKDRVTKKNVGDELKLAARYADSDADSAKSADPSVARTVQGFAAGESLMQAAARIAAGERESAVALLTEREQILRRAADTLHEPGFLRDADRLARLAGHATESTGLGDPLVLAMLFETAGRSRLR
jgi:Ca-activated chloride channel homolog